MDIVRVWTWSVIPPAPTAALRGPRWITSGHGHIVAATKETSRASAAAATRLRRRSIYLAPGPSRLREPASGGRHPARMRGHPSTYARREPSWLDRLRGHGDGRPGVHKSGSAPERAWHRGSLVGHP
jgi:hypothetical protein